MTIQVFRALAILGVLAVLTTPSPVGARTQSDSVRPAVVFLDIDSPAAQLRLALNSTLAEHAFLLGEAIRTGVEEGADFESAGAALEADTVRLVDMIEGVYGADAGSSFGDLWRSHIAYLIDYTRALAEDDADAQSLAQEQLDDYVAAFSALLASANPNLPQPVVADLIDEHVQQLEAVAHFSTGEYADAFSALRHTYAHMYTIGDGLAQAIAIQFPDTFTGQSMAFSPAADLRISLDQLLGEHTILSMIAMRAGLAEDAAQKSAAAALAENTTELSAAIGRIYGDTAGNAFEVLWQSHTDAYLDYAAGTANEEEGLQAEALDRLEADQNDLADSLAGANPNLDAGDLTGLFRMHTQQLVTQADAYAARDFHRAYDIAHEAFVHSGIMGTELASAIANQFPELFPDTATANPGGPKLAWAGLILVFVSLLTMPPAIRVAVARAWRIPRCC